ncbi:DUF1648 domain-containing protein [Bhargavaea ullalensis]|uniref:Membrane protein n=1 Tax=Bhargavaea ullalensis TaxID=1265685 RepID=A0ABV2GEE9_9BACL
MKTYDRPKIDVPKTTLERLFDWVAGLVFIAGLVYLAVVWGELPDRVPGHFNGAGEVDRWGSKWELLLLPAIAAATTAFMAFFERHPEWHNYMVSLNEENIEFQYRNSRQMLNVTKNMILLVFTFLSWQSARVALGEAESLGMLFLPLFLAATFVPLIFFIVRSVRNQ